MFDKYAYAFAFGRDDSEVPAWVEKLKEIKEQIVKAKGGSSSSAYKDLYNAQVKITKATQAENEKRQAEEDSVISSDDGETGSGTLLTGSQGAIVNAKNKRSTTLLGV